MEFQVFNFGCLVRVLHAAALRWLPGAVAPCSRGFTQCGVRGRGAAERFWQGYNKPANLSARGRGYRRDTIWYQTQTLGAHRDPKIAAPRAASPNSGSLLARRISASRAPRRAPAPPPRPRRFRTHIPDMRAAPPPPPHPLLSYAGRAQAVRRRAKPKRTSPVIVNTLARKRKRWSPRAARARATRRPRARSAAAASRPTRSRPTRPSARPGPLGRTSPRPRNLLRRRTPTRPSLADDVEERIARASR